MIGYVTLGTNDLQKAAKFYDELFKNTNGAQRMMEEERFITWGTEEHPNIFGVTIPFNNGPATVSNGGMVAISLCSRKEVDAFYEKAMELGASDEGKPGPRFTDAFYASYFRDLDGNKLAAFYFDKSQA